MSIKKVLNDLKSTDLSIDSTGKVIIANKRIAEALKEALEISDSVAHNGNCNCLPRLDLTRVLSHADPMAHNGNCNCLREFEIKAVSIADTQAHNGNCNCLSKNELERVVLEIEDMEAHNGNCNCQKNPLHDSVADKNTV